VCTPLVDQQFGYVRLAAPLLDFAGISTDFADFVAKIGWHYSASNARYFEYNFMATVSLCIFTGLVKEYPAELS